MLKIIFPDLWYISLVTLVTFPLLANYFIMKTSALFGTGDNYHDSGKIMLEAFGAFMSYGTKKFRQLSKSQLQRVYALHGYWISSINKGKSLYGPASKAMVSYLRWR